MAKYNSTNNDLLRDSKRNTTPKIYSLLCDLVNDEREDLAELVLYLMLVMQQKVKIFKKLKKLYLKPKKE